MCKQTDQPVASNGQVLPDKTSFQLDTIENLSFSHSSRMVYTSSLRHSWELAYTMKNKFLESMTLIDQKCDSSLKLSVNT